MGEENNKHQMALWRMQHRDTIEKKEKLNPNDLAEYIIYYPGRKIITFQDTDEILRYDEQNQTGVYKPAKTEIEYELQELAESGCSKHLVEETLAAIRRQTRVSRDIISTNPYLIPMQNCIYDATTKTTMPYSKEHIFLHKHPIEYNPQATCPKINKFLTEIAGKEKDIMLLKEMVGYCFIRHYHFENIFLLVGEGANGKSTFINILSEILGEESVAHKSFQLLTNYLFGANTLFGKNANLFADLPQRAFTDTGMLKALSGTDKIETEIKFKGSISFRNYAKLIGSCNEAPESPDDSDAFYRRWVIIPFPNKFEGKNEVKGLYEQLITPEELSGFFNETINAYLAAEQKGEFSYNATTQEKKKQYLGYSNNVKAFCEECLEQDDNAEIPKSELYTEYKAYCQKQRLKEKSLVWFFRALYKTFGGAVRQSRKEKVFVVTGIAFKEDEKEIIEKPVLIPVPATSSSWLGRCQACNNIKKIEFIDEKDFTKGYCGGCAERIRTG